MSKPFAQQFTGTLAVLSCIAAISFSPISKADAGKADPLNTTHALSASTVSSMVMFPKRLSGLGKHGKVKRDGFAIEGEFVDLIRGTAVTGVVLIGKPGVSLKRALLDYEAGLLTPTQLAAKLTAFVPTSEGKFRINDLPRGDRMEAVALATGYDEQWFQVGNLIYPAAVIRLEPFKLRRLGYASQSSRPSQSSLSNCWEASCVTALSATESENRR